VLEAFAVLALSNIATANTIIFTSTFSDPNNVGTIGGSLLSGSATDVLIHDGPWRGTYHGILSLLAAPSLAISTTGGTTGGQATISGTTGGQATISGVAGVNLLGLGLTNNYGWFYQNTGVAYQPNTGYLLTADVSVGAALASVDLLSTSGVGIALTYGSDNIVARSTDAGALLSVDLLPDDTTYRVQLAFITGDTAPTGNIGIRLYDQPSGLLTVDLLDSASFSNVRLEEFVPTPEPATFALSGAALLALMRWKRPARRPPA
jgi:hypothetical protein